VTIAGPSTAAAIGSRAGGAGVGVGAPSPSAEVDPDGNVELKIELNANVGSGTSACVEKAKVVEGAEDEDGGSVYETGVWSLNWTRSRRLRQLSWNQSCEIGYYCDREYGTRPESQHGE
jgi:hypothetical protein